jgi:hypothetical protein
MGVIAGLATWACALSSAQSDGPSGDIIYFLAEKAAGNLDFMQKVKPKYGGGSYSNHDGKKAHKITLSGIRIVAAVGANRTAEFNLVISQLLNWADNGDVAIYLHIKNLISSLYFTLMKKSGTNYGYIQGIVRNVQWHYEGANNIWIDSITFEECQEN